MEIRDIYGDLPVLETDRLILRKVTRDDIEDMFFYGSDPEVSKYVTWNKHETIEDTKAFVELILDKYENSQLAPWGIEFKENGKFIGTIDIVSWQPNHKVAEVGYALSKDYWGKGIMTEATKAVIKFGFENMDLVRIQARCFVENAGSYRVMEKAGMSFEGILRKVMFAKGKHHDLKMYAIVKE